MLKNTKNGGSNEPPKFFLDILLKQWYNNRVEISGCSLVVELQPSKLIVWVRFPSSAPKNKKAPVGCFFIFGKADRESNVGVNKTLPRSVFSPPR